MYSDEKCQKINYFTFNHINNTFLTCTEEGFNIYSINPFKKLSSHLTAGGIGYIEPIYNQRRYPDVYAVIAGGSNPAIGINKVVIYDAKKKKLCIEISFRSPVRAVRFGRNEIVAVVDEKIYIYSWPGLKLIDEINTRKNSSGLCRISSSRIANIIVCPGLQMGNIHIRELKNYKNMSSSSDGPLSLPLLVNAHNGNIAALAINKDGTLIATASDKGTIIRIFDSRSGKKLKEVRRGHESCQIYNIEFSDNSRRILCTSNHGTIHIFSLPLLSSIGYGSPTPNLSLSPSLSPLLSSSLSSSSPTRLSVSSKFSPPLFSLAALSSPSNNDRLENKEIADEKRSSSPSTPKNINDDELNSVNGINNDNSGDNNDNSGDNNDGDDDGAKYIDHSNYGEEKRGGESFKPVSPIMPRSNHSSPIQDKKSSFSQENKRMRMKEEHNSKDSKDYKNAGLKDEKNSSDNIDDEEEEEEEEEDEYKNSKSLFSFAGDYIKYFSSEWSFSQFRLPFKEYHIATFASGSDNIIYVISSTNRFYMLEYISAGAEGSKGRWDVIAIEMFY